MTMTEDTQEDFFQTIQSNYCYCYTHYNKKNGGGLVWNISLSVLSATQYFISLFIYCIYLFGGKGKVIDTLLRSEDSLQELIHSFYHLSPGDQT